MRPRRADAESAKEMEEKGYLTWQEVNSWASPHRVHTTWSDLTEQWSDQNRYLLNGHIECDGKTCGRWYVRYSLQGSHEKGLGLHPHRVFNLVYLHRSLQRLDRFTRTIIRRKYDSAAKACRKALPEGGVIYFQPTEINGVSYCQTIHVPKPRDPNGEGLSFGSTRLESTDHPLQQLAREGHAHLGEDVSKAWRRETTFCSKRYVVQQLLLVALVRQLPEYKPDRNRVFLPKGAQIRVLDTVYHFVCNREHGWTLVLTIADNDKESLLQFNFQEGA